MQGGRVPRGGPVTAAHVPSLPLTSHASHWPVQFDSQQTRSTQNPDEQSPESSQESPFARRGTQVPASQNVSPMHSASFWQEVAQPPGVQRYGAQDMPAVSLRQVPSPLQMRPTTSLPTQLEAPHAIPAGYSRQAPAPSQVPSRWQVDAPSSVQSSRGSEPAFAGPHAPSAPDSFRLAAHAWQEPLQGESQHTASTQ